MRSSLRPPSFEGESKMQNSGELRRGNGDACPFFTRHDGGTWIEAECHHAVVLAKARTHNHRALFLR